MKKINLLLFSSIIASANAQVGIGTSDIESGVILKVVSKFNMSNNLQGGILLPNLNLTGTQAYVPAVGTPVDGLLVYNTANTTGTNNVSAGHYYWDQTASKWDDLYNPIKNDICKYSNQDITTNFNDGSTYMDLFSNFIENENTTLYQKVNGTTLKITRTGLYKVILNLDMRIRQTSQDRDLFGVGLFLDGTRVSGQVVVMTNETASGTTQRIGKAITLFLTVPSGGGDLRVRGYDIHGASDILFSNVKTSSISVERVR